MFVMYKKVTIDGSKWSIDKIRKITCNNEMHYLFIPAALNT